MHGGQWPSETGVTSENPSCGIPQMVAKECAIFLKTHGLNMGRCAVPKDSCQQWAPWHGLLLGR